MAWMCLGAVWLMVNGARAANPLPRIAVVGGQFVNTRTSQPFTPWGFNYIRLYQGWHGTFRPGGYDAAEAEAMLEDLATHHFNIVRVFIDPMLDRGVAANPPTSMVLQAAYLDNYADFVSRARANGVYVITTLTDIPFIYRYMSLTWPYLDPRDQSINTTNQYYNNIGFINARAYYLSDMADALRQRDPTLLSTVFSYELQNELCMLANAYPFNQPDGTTVVGPKGVLYPINGITDRMALADLDFETAISAAATQLHQVDPQALLATSIFTPRAVGRGSPADIAKTSPDPRFPASLTALAASGASYLDVHLYPDASGAAYLEADLNSIGWWTQGQALAQQAGLPVMMGEFGAFTSRFSTVTAARDAMINHLNNVEGAGFGGYVYWTYDTWDQSELWNAKSSGGVIFNALAGQAIPPPPLSPPSIVLSPTTLDHTLWRGNSLPNDTFAVVNGGQQTLNYTITSSAAWLSIAPANGTSTGESHQITVSYHVSGLAIGDQTASITVGDPAASNSPQVIEVTLHILAPGDFDHDGAVDQGDFGHLQQCLTDGIMPKIDPACRDADLDGNTVVDADDIALFFKCLSGPKATPDPDCGT